ncbi:hypothetical protein HDU97_003520 [Phlyctochytrium planicorne]|nr:hypothetical protein HDU97_003520 [Phlyctochytrium planicorne]
MSSINFASVAVAATAIAIATYLLYSRTRDGGSPSTMSSFLRRALKPASWLRSFSTTSDTPFHGWTNYFEGFYLTDIKKHKEGRHDDIADERLALNRGIVPRPTVFCFPATSKRNLKAIFERVDPDMPGLHLYGLTGWDPLGKAATPQENAVANKRLKELLQGNPTVTNLWRAVGFTAPPDGSGGSDTATSALVDEGGEPSTFVAWQLEHGFLVGCKSKDKNACTEAIKGIAKDFGQGAVFSYSFELEEEGKVLRLMRTTVPVLVACPEETSGNIPRKRRNGTDSLLQTAGRKREVAAADRNNEEGKNKVGRFCLDRNGKACRSQQVDIYPLRSRIAERQVLMPLSEGNSESTLDGAANVSEETLGPHQANAGGDNASQRSDSLSRLGGIALIFNNMTGIGLSQTSQTYQQSGYIVTTIFFIIFMIISSLSALFVVEAMQAIPGNKYFQGTVEFGTLINFYFGPWSHILGQICLFGALQGNAVASIIQSSQTVDNLLIDAFGKTCALGFPDSKISWFCVTERQITLSPFGDTHILFSFGILMVALCVIPMLAFPLAENVWIQIVSFILTIGIFAQWIVASSVEGYDVTNVPAVGPPSGFAGLIGVVMLNFAFIQTVPAWVNIKSPSVNIQKSIWTSTGIGMLSYIVTGLVPAFAFTIPRDANLLTVMASKNLVNKIFGYLFSLLVLMTSIPVMVVISHMNLTQNLNISGFWGISLCYILPWIVSIPFQTGSWLLKVNVWCSLIFISTANFVVPLCIYLKAAHFRKAYNQRRVLTEKQRGLLRIIHSHSSAIHRHLNEHEAHARRAEALRQGSFVHATPPGSPRQTKDEDVWITATGGPTPSEHAGVAAENGLLSVPGAAERRDSWFTGGLSSRGGSVGPGAPNLSVSDIGLTPGSSEHDGRNGSLMVPSPYMRTSVNLQNGFVPSSPVDPSINPMLKDADPESEHYLFEDVPDPEAELDAFRNILAIPADEESHRGRSRWRHTEYGGSLATAGWHGLETGDFHQATHPPRRYHGNGSFLDSFHFPWDQSRSGSGSGRSRSRRRDDRIRSRSRGSPSTGRPLRDESKENKEGGRGSFGENQNQGSVQRVVPPLLSVSPPEDGKDGKSLAVSIPTFLISSADYHGRVPVGSEANDTPPLPSSLFFSGNRGVEGGSSVGAGGSTLADGPNLSVSPPTDGGGRLARPIVTTDMCESPVGQFEEFGEDDSHIGAVEVAPVVGQSMHESRFVGLGVVDAEGRMEAQAAAAGVEFTSPNGVVGLLGAGTGGDGGVTPVGGAGAGVVIGGGLSPMKLPDVSVSPTDAKPNTTAGKDRQQAFLTVEGSAVGSKSVSIPSIRSDAAESPNAPMDESTRMSRSLSRPISAVPPHLRNSPHLRPQSIVRRTSTSSTVATHPARSQLHHRRPGSFMYPSRSQSPPLNEAFVAVASVAPAFRSIPRWVPIPPRWIAIGCLVLTASTALMNIIYNAGGWGANDLGDGE